MQLLHCNKTKVRFLLIWLSNLLTGAYMMTVIPERRHFHVSSLHSNFRFLHLDFHHLSFNIQ